MAMNWLSVAVSRASIWFRRSSDTSVGTTSMLEMLPPFKFALLNSASRYLTGDFSTVSLGIVNFAL